jgi:2-polyprenyl-3-methyl-5-hydroxy-6-metoxy-1,4-benzoquinol methylase
MTHQDWRKQEWEAIGTADPYFAVVWHDEYRSSVFDEAARAQFFKSGERDIAATIEGMERLIGRPFRPARALDFGCGVGRLTLALARMSGHVVGVDISSAMLDEAARNATRYGIANVSFHESRPALAGVEGPFDFVHSMIVLQHIPLALGYAYVSAMLDRLSPSGAGMLHVMYGARTTVLRRAAQIARRRSRLVHRLLNVAQGRPFRTPVISLFEYDLVRLIEMIEARGCPRVLVELTNHGGDLGAMLYFARPGAYANDQR